MFRRPATLRAVYELRTYDIKPKYFPDYLALTSEKFGLRVAHSKLLGFWIAEIGGQNQVVHIWEYDSLMQRKAVRDALGKDAQWGAEYLAHARKYFAKQDSVFMTTDKDIKAATQPFYRLWQGPLSAAGSHAHHAHLLGEWKIGAGGPDGQIVRLYAGDNLDNIAKGAMEADSGTGFGKLMLPAPFSSKYCSLWK